MIKFREQRLEMQDVRRHVRNDIHDIRRLERSALRRLEREQSGLQEDLKTLAAIRLQRKGSDRSVSLERAKELALAAAGLTPERAAFSRATRTADGYYDLEFAGGGLVYECYVDAFTGEVPGLNSWPEELG